MRVVAVELYEGVTVAVAVPVPVALALPVTLADTVTEPDSVVPVENSMSPDHDEPVLIVMLPVFPSAAPPLQ